MSARSEGQTSNRKCANATAVRHKPATYPLTLHSPVLVPVLLISTVLVITNHGLVVVPTNAILSRLNPRRLVSFALSSKPNSLIAEPVQNKLPQKLAPDLSQEKALEARRDHSTDLLHSTLRTREHPFAVTTLRPFEQLQIKATNSSGITGNRQVEAAFDTEPEISRNSSTILEDLVQQLLERTRASDGKLIDHQTNDISPMESAVNEEDVLVEPTQVPFVQLLTIADSPHAQTIEVTSETTTKPADERLQKLQQDYEDRFIHYDTNSQASSFSGPAAVQQMSIGNRTLNDETPLSGLLPVIRANQLERLGDSHLSIVQDENSELSGNATRQNRTSGQTGERIIQARSMGSQVPQHSKPPYASYNQFHERANLLRQSATTTPTALMPTRSPILNTPPVTAHRNKPEPIEPQMQSANEFGHKSQKPSKDITQQMPQKYSNPSKAEINQSLNILHSIGQISSHLASTSSDPAAESGSVKPEIGVQLNIDATNGTNLGSHIDRRDESDIEIKTLRNRLAPASQSVIDLSPIPDAGEGSNRYLGGATGDLKQLASLQTGEDSSSRFYFSPNVMSQSLMAPAASGDSQSESRRYSDRVSHNDRYFGTSAHANSTTDSSDHTRLGGLSMGQNDDSELRLTERNRVASTSQGSAHDFRATTPPQLHDLPLSSWQMQQHKKMAESLRGQIINSDKSMHQESVEQANQHKLELSKAMVQSVASVASAMLGSSKTYHNNNGTNNNTDNLRGHKHMASLTNITAPIVSPASATEAMKTALDIGQTSRRVLYRPNVNNKDLLSAPNTTTDGRKPPQRIGAPSFYQAASLDMPTSYSAPANQLFLMDSFPKSAQNESTDDEKSAAAGNAVDRLNFGGSLSVSNAALGETMRAQSSSETNITRIQQASGFRSPTTAEPQHMGASGITEPQRNNLATHSPSSFISSPSSYLSKGTFDGSTPGANDKHRTVAQGGSGGALLSLAASPSPKPINQSGRPSVSEVSSVAGVFSTESGLAAQANATTGSVSPHHTTTTTSVSTMQPSSMAEFLSLSTGATSGGGGGGQNGAKRALNLTRVEHISADCSDDLIRAVIIFNGTFKGIIYSSGYVRDPSCLYINGTGKTRYDFSIRLNQCGTLGRQELHTPTGPNDVRRRDQVVWNTLSIQYNPIIEQEWDEHFRVSCEYGSDFWKTVSFSPFNVETNTGSPVVFTVNPPQCQMEILRGHGMVGPRQEAVSGPVTVGDPLTLLIHMKSERAGYDILVKNCVAHNGGQQKMQLIDTNGCVVNERFISPFRGTYNDNDLKHVTLYAYLKAFRFTGSPVLYLECEVHMCQSSCPVSTTQMFIIWLMCLFKRAII